MLSLKKEQKIFLITVVIVIAAFLAISFLIKRKRFTCPLASLVKAKLNSSQTKPININKATSQELSSIKGIGSVLASRIIDYINTKGSFESIEELKEVKGIGEYKFNQIKDEVFIE
ncbi:MAG: helix-hairpin-helix domain-containing protein [Candidatus Gygaella obscura]|nr:helix-hairpin-helix domain-containing protein [Candidatus Gygaella obscura]